MMSVVHNTAHGDEACCREGHQRDPGLDGVAALIEQMHFASNVKTKEAKASPCGCIESSALTTGLFVETHCWHGQKEMI